MDTNLDPDDFYSKLLKEHSVNSETISSDHLSHNIYLYSPEFASKKVGKMVEIYLIDKTGNTTNTLTKGRKILSKNGNPKLFIIRTIGYSYLVGTTSNPKKLEVVKVVENNY